jgi:hypothetical protein
MGRMFAYWAIVLLGAVFYFRSSQKILVLHFSAEAVIRVSWASFWGDFSQTHLVTLLKDQEQMLRSRFSVLYIKPIA